MVYIRYRDDGPVGCCGQCCSITSPRDILWYVEDWTVAEELRKRIEKDTVRKNSRVDGMWSTDETDCLNPAVKWEA